MTTIYPKPYRPKGKKNWMFRYTDGTGNRKSKSTGTTNKTKAQKIIRDFIDQLQDEPVEDITLRDIINLYRDPETNPRYQDSITQGKPYSPRHVRNTTLLANYLYDTLDEKGFSDKLLARYTRRNIKDASQLVVNKHGHTVKAQKMYKLLKLVFSQAFDDGYIPNNPAGGLPDIKVIKKRAMIALPPEDIRYVISCRELFISEFVRDIFIVLISTGMRRSEFLALTAGQIKGDILVIDRAYKDDSRKIIGLPKWDIKRAIPLPKMTQKALKRIFAERNSIDIYSRSLYLWIRNIGVKASLRKKIQRPEAWAAVSPHILRHSLTTMLRVSGLSDVLIAEYLSWVHQDQSLLSSIDMLNNYTQINAENLRAVADRIDELIGKESRSGKVISIN
ncbi:MAG: tyrosine-type recombinase/integrase [Spirochaetia bacterium]|nr:tyrosine-type recombinase/integrase [Spirochaetia bacterium]